MGSTIQKMFQKNKHKSFNNTQSVYNPLLYFQLNVEEHNPLEKLEIFASCIAEPFRLNSDPFSYVLNIDKKVREMHQTASNSTKFLVSLDSSLTNHRSNNRSFTSPSCSPISIRSTCVISPASHVSLLDQ